MGTRLPITMTVLALLLVLVAADVSAQVVFGQPTAGGLRFVYNSWKIETDGNDTTISQFVMPLTGFVPVQENLDLSFFVASSSNKLQTPSEDFTLNGLTDFRVQGRHSFYDDRVLVSLGLNLPTGKRELNYSEEWQVLQAMSANYIELPMRRLGEGFGFNVLVGGAGTLGEKVKAGIGLSYNYVGSYTPYDSLTDFNPGDVFAINASTEITDDDLTYDVGLIYSLYTTDKAGDVESFRQSPSADIRFGLSRKGDAITYGAMARYVLRGKNKTFDQSTGEEIGLLKIYGNEFSIAGHLAWTMAEDWQIVPLIEMRKIGGNDVNFDHSTVFGFGGSAGRALGENLSINGGFKLYTGSASTFERKLISETVPELGTYKATSSSDLSGYQITLGLTASM